MSEHRWSGWPGAWCLDCGAEDPREIALADGRCDENGIATITQAEYEAMMECPEPGSNRHNPYVRGRCGPDSTPAGSSGLRAQPEKPSSD